MLYNSVKKIPKVYTCLLLYLYVVFGLIFKRVILVVRLSLKYTVLESKAQNDLYNNLFV